MNAKLNSRIAGAALLLVVALLIAGAGMPSHLLAQRHANLPRMASQHRICINPPCGWQPAPSLTSLNTGRDRRICVNPPCGWKWIPPTLTRIRPALALRLGSWSCNAYPCRLPALTGTARPSPALAAVAIPRGCIDLMCPRGYYRDAWCRCRPKPLATPLGSIL